MHARLDENLHQESVPHHQLGDEIDVIILPPPVPRRQRRLIARLLRRELLEELIEVQRRALTAVIIISIDV